MSTMFRTSFSLGLIGLFGACGKKDDAPASSAVPSAGGTSVSTAAATGAAGTGAAAPTGGGPGKILAQCMNKANASCKESYRQLPAAAEDFCKGLEGTGVFTKGEKPCPKDDLLSTCEFAGQEQTEITYHYHDKSLPLAQQLEGSKAACTMIDGKFVEAPRRAEPKAAAPKKKK